MVLSSLRFSLAALPLLYLAACEDETSQPPPSLLDSGPDSDARRLQDIVDGRVPRDGGDANQPRCIDKQLLVEQDTDCNGSLDLTDKDAVLTLLGLSSADRVGYNGNRMNLDVSDVNGDGTLDTLVGASGHGGDAFNGAAYLCLSQNGIRLLGDVVLENSCTKLIGGRDWACGTDVVSTDLNNDDIADILIGCPGFNNGAGLSVIAYGRNATSVFGDWQQTYPLDEMISNTDAELRQSGFAFLRDPNGQLADLAGFGGRLGISRDLDGNGLDHLLFASRREFLFVLPLQVYLGLQDLNTLMRSANADLKSYFFILPFSEQVISGLANADDFYDLGLAQRSNDSFAIHGLLGGSHWPAFGPNGDAIDLRNLADAFPIENVSLTSPAENLDFIGPVASDNDPESDDLAFAFSSHGFFFVMPWMAVESLRQGVGNGEEFDYIQAFENNPDSLFDLGVKVFRGDLNDLASFAKGWLMIQRTSPDVLFLSAGDVDNSGPDDSSTMLASETQKIQVSQLDGRDTAFTGKADLACLTAKDNQTGVYCFTNKEP